MSRGCRSARASPWAVASATRTPVNEPGPRVATTASSSARSRPAARSSRSTPAMTSSERGVGPASATRPGAAAAGESSANSRRGPHAAIASTDLTASVLPLRRVPSSTTLQSAGMKQTPMLQQYLELKRQHRDALLLYRLGRLLRAVLRGRREGGADPRHRAHAAAPQRRGRARRCAAFRTTRWRATSASCSTPGSRSRSPSRSRTRPRRAGWCAGR